MVMTLDERQDERRPEEKRRSKSQCGNENERALLDELVDIRKHLNITQAELAQISGNSQQEISRLEKQKHSPSIKTLCRILNSIDYELCLTKRTSERST